MSQQKSLVDRALDLMVFAPLGLAADQGEELAHLAAKGRRRVEPQMAMAKVVGRLAFGQLQKEMERQMTETAARVRLLFGGGPTLPARDRPHLVESPDLESPDLVESTEATATADHGGTHHRPGRDATDTPATPTPSTRAGGRARGTGRRPRAAQRDHEQPVAPASADLPVHGYDALSAPQVVQRLAGLSEEELETVRAYEAATRGRRTILTRIAQLQAGSGG